MWIARLTDSQRDALKALIAAQGEVGPSRRGPMSSSTWRAGTISPAAELLVDRVAELAKTQGRRGGRGGTRVRHEGAAREFEQALRHRESAARAGA